MSYNPVEVDIKEIKAEKYFRRPKNGHISDYRITDIGKYSIASIWLSNHVGAILRTYTDKKRPTITDATGGIGGNTMGFSRYFSHVNSVEENKIHHEILKSNVNVYGAKNIKVIKGNYDTKFRTLKQDILFIDPPWGGPDVLRKKNVNLKFARHNLWQAAKRYATASDGRLVVAFNLPRTYDFGKFISNNAYFEKVTIHNINRNVKLLVCH